LIEGERFDEIEVSKKGRRGVQSGCLDSEEKKKRE